MPIDAAVLEAMHSLGVAYEQMDCDPDLADTASFCEAYGVPLERSANTILVACGDPKVISQRAWSWLPPGSMSMASSGKSWESER